MSILVCHHITPRWIWGINSLTPGQLRNFLATAVKQGIHFVTLSQYIAKMDEPAQKRVALTFDDGYSDIETIALSICREFGVVATVFVLPLYAGKYNSWDVNWFGQKIRHLDWPQIGKLVDAGWEIGSHGLSHRDLSRLPETDCAEELRVSRQLIYERSGNWPAAIAYPFGNVSRKTVQLATDIGYRAGVVSSNKFDGFFSKMTLSRIGVYRFDTRRLFVQKCLGKNKQIVHYLQRGIDFCSNGTVVVKQLIPTQWDRIRASRE